MTITNTMWLIICWDLWSRNTNRSIISRWLGLAFAMLLSIFAVFSIMYVGIHAYNQMIMSIFLSNTFFGFFTFHESKLIHFFETLITKGINWKSYFCKAMFLSVHLMGAYFITLACTIGYYDFSKFGNQGSCHNCAHEDFYIETYMSIMLSVNFVSLILVLCARKHTYEFISFNEMKI